VKLITFVIISFALFSACKKSGGGDAGTAQLSTNIHYIDSSGNDLFSTNNDGQNGFWMDSLIVGNIKTGSLYQTLNCFNNNTHAYQFETLVVLETQICPNYNLENRYSYTLIQLKPGVIDTLKIHITSDAITPSTNIDTLWYNGVIKRYDDSIGAIAITR